MHPMIAVSGTLLILGVGFFLFYQYVKHHG